jgi:HSP20 family protein
MTQNPFEEMERAFERMGRRLEDLGEHSTAGTILVDVEDRGDEYVVRADLPGFDRDDIEVRYDDSTLELAADRTTAETDREEGRFIRRERRASSMRRSVYLPKPVDPEATTATYDAGVLTVTLPRTEPASRGTDIPVN